MTVNQRIIEVLTRGAISRVAEILGTSSQNVSKKLNANKEIDSVSFINAVCKVTGLAFIHFTSAYGVEDVSRTYDIGQVNEPANKYGTTKEAAYKDGADYWKAKHDELEAVVDLMRTNAEQGNDLLAMYKRDNERLLADNKKLKEKYGE